jgi:hypothetical protein
MASCESDIKLQRALFLTAQAYENIDSHALVVNEKEEQLIALTEELKTLALSPFRVSLLNFIVSNII